LLSSRLVSLRFYLAPPAAPRPSRARGGANRLARAISAARSAPSPAPPIQHRRETQHSQRPPLLAPPRCRRMAASVVSSCCSADRRQCHTEAEPRRVSASPTASSDRHQHHRGRPPRGGCSLPTGASPTRAPGRSTSLPLRKASEAINPFTAIVEAGCRRTPRPSSRRQPRRAPRAREAEQTG